MRDFRDLAVWAKAHQLTLAVYRETSNFPVAELYGLTSQMRRAVASVPANIAEGCGRNGGADFARFLQIALGSASELEYHLLLARDLGYLNSVFHETMQIDTVEVKKMLTSLIQKLRTDR
ncbi:four helix bundle protein [Sulfurimicrobium lacus]|uniref:Four helix bundle protein n=1 Tax=Sulfurimicrobium lacus TaxID=2715678 RepID=A0A6F8V6D6_9PROT|nr:four helix bundle protein [Sulfurimicrobium lacus]BCB25393.1 four helix bundle protein [Sulfurimicrobium lacus]